MSFLDDIGDSISDGFEAVGDVVEGAVDTIKENPELAAIVGAIIFFTTGIPTPGVESIGAEALMAESMGLATAADVAAVEASLGTATTGISADAAATLTGEAVGSAAANTAATGGTGAEIVTGGVEAAAPAGFPGEVVGQFGGPTGLPLPTESAGMMDWFGKLPGTVQYGLVSGAMNLGGGILKGVGDASMQEDLLEQKAQQERDMLDWKRRFIQGGSYYDVQNRMKPGQGVLKRPDGRPVYAPGGGLVNATMKGG